MGETGGVKAWFAAGLVVATVLAGCGSSGTQGVPATTTAAVVATATTMASRTPTADAARDPLGATSAAIAASPILHAPGWLIYLRGADLYAGDLASGTEVPLTRDSLGASYAGQATIAGTTWLYYSSLVSRVQPPRELTGLFAVFRRPLGGSDADEERIVEFSASGRYLSDLSPMASVSPDGRFVVYTDDVGVHLYDVDSHDDRRLLSNQPSSVVNTPGNHYASPFWAPAGGWLLLTRTGTRRPYDTQGNLETIQPLEPITEYTLGGGGKARWNADGSQLCGNTSTTVAAGIGIITPGTYESRDLTPNLFDNAILRPAVDSCVWADDGRLAVGYDTDNLRHFIIAILDGSGMPIAHVDAGAVWPSVDFWLPDQTGFVIETLTGASTFHASAVMLDGTYRRFPFEAGRVVGTISVANA
jgi:hypothetical protein